MTSVFIDVVGSTEVTVRLGPERMQRLLGEAFNEMSATIAEHGGVVEKYVGDAILALFGAPTSHADDAERALRAADACVRWGSASTSSGPGLAVRAGIETGELLVDLQAVESRQRMVVGESINLAARLEQFAEPGQIVVGPRCHEATSAVADFEAMGEVSLKGLQNVEGWRFAGFRDAAEATEVGFVGREAELAKLRDAFDRARGTATLALIVGPPGQGKSRLAAEAIRQAAPAPLLEARCRPGTETGVNTPLRQLVESDVPDATPDAVHQRLSALIGASDGPDIAAAICHSSGLAVDKRLLAITRYEQRELIARAWQRYLEALAADGPLSVIVEDLHWADPVTLRVIDHVTSDVERLWSSSRPPAPSSWERHTCVRVRIGCRSTLARSGRELSRNSRSLPATAAQLPALRSSELPGTRSSSSSSRVRGRGRLSSPSRFRLPSPPGSTS